MNKDIRLFLKNAIDTLNCNKRAIINTCYGTALITFDENNINEVKCDNCRFCVSNRNKFFCGITGVGDRLR